MTTGATRIVREKIMKGKRTAKSFTTEEKKALKLMGKGDLSLREVEKRVWGAQAGNGSWALRLGRRAKGK